MKFSRRMHLLPLTLLQRLQKLALRQQRGHDICTKMVLMLEFFYQHYIYFLALSGRSTRGSFNHIYIYISWLTSHKLNFFDSTEMDFHHYCLIFSNKIAWSSGHIFGWVQCISKSTLCQVAACDMLGRHTGDWMMCSDWAFHSNQIDDATVTQNKQHSTPFNSVKGETSSETSGGNCYPCISTKMMSLHYFQANWHQFDEMITFKTSGWCQGNEKTSRRNTREMAHVFGH